MARRYFSFPEDICNYLRLFLNSCHNSAKVWITHTEYTISKKQSQGELTLYVIADTYVLSRITRSLPQHLIIGKVTDIWVEAKSKILNLDSNNYMGKFSSV